MALLLGMQPASQCDLAQVPKVRHLAKVDCPSSKLPQPSSSVAGEGIAEPICGHKPNTEVEIAKLKAPTFAEYIFDSI
jgi:hypothetical protein